MSNRGFNRQSAENGPAHAWIAALLLLLLMGLLAGGAARRESVTIDEVAHIGAGVSYLQTLDLRLNEEHPPLAKVWAALPLVLHGVHADYSHISWTFSGKKFFGAYFGQWIFGDYLLTRWGNLPSVMLARLPMLLLALALGWAIFVLGRRMGGSWAGLLCLSVYVSSPVFLAFGPLVHTDIPVTLFTLLSLWTFAEIWKQPDRKKSLLFGLCLAAAILSKFTAGILFFAFGIFAFTTRWWPVSGQPPTKPESKLWRRSRWRATLRGIGWAAAFVYIFYFVFSLRQPTDSLDFIGHGTIFIVVRRLLMPPWLMLRGLFMVLITGSRPTFILGHAYPHGVWFYYPVVFLLKSSIGFLGLLLFALTVALWTRRNGKRVLNDEVRVHWRVLWVSLIVFTVVCLLSRLDISIRHFAVPIVLLIMILAPVPNIVFELRHIAPNASRACAAVVIVLVASSVLVASHAYPFYFPYTNALSLGHPNFALINDSNVDWNQSIPEVKRFAEQHGLKRLALDWYGITDSTIDVPGSYEWNCQQPAPGDAGGWAVVSANLILDSRNCVWLLQYPHEILAGGSMLAVQLPGTIPAPGTPGGPPLPVDFHQFFGAPFDIRTMFIGLNRNPDSLPDVYESMAAKFQQQFAAAKKNKGSVSQTH